MALIASPRHTRADLALWAGFEREDAVRARLRSVRALFDPAIDAIAAFAAAGPCYVGVSWGKDSTVVAHLAWRLAVERGVRLPLAWVRREPIDNPECYLVRDAFLARFHEIAEHEERVDCVYDPAHPECWWVSGDPRRSPNARPKQQGFARVAALFGDRYVSGVRGAESSDRKKRMQSSGVATQRTCAPIGWWPTAAVFAYLHAYDLPVHPAYAMTMGGMYPRDRLRVGGIGSHHGRGHGRAEWEARYYPDVVRLGAV